jgi:hypothetical protein
MRQVLFTILPWPILLYSCTCSVIPCLNASLILSCRCFWLSFTAKIYSASLDFFLVAISFWQPIASIVIQQPFTINKSSRAGMAVISLLLSLFYLPQYHAVLIAPCTYHVNDGFLTLFATVTHPFAINTYTCPLLIWAIDFTQLIKQFCNSTGVNEGKHPVEGVMRWNAARKFQNGFQPVFFLLSIGFYIVPVFCSAVNGCDGDEQNVN